MVQKHKKFSPLWIQEKKGSPLNHGFCMFKQKLRAGVQHGS